MRLANEEGELERILMYPESVDVHRPEIQFMYQHLAWRLGYHIRYTLPIWLMSLDYGKIHTVIRRQRMLRHELRDFFNNGYSIVLAMDCDHGSQRDDLKLMLGLAQRTMDMIDRAVNVQRSNRFTGGQGNLTAQRLLDTKMPKRAIDIAPILEMIRRNFKSAFSFQTQQGIDGICTIHNLAPPTLRAWIREEDFIVIWRNLWSNARKMLDDYSRDTPRPGLRYPRQNEIILKYGRFSDRFPEVEAPVPIVVAVLYDRYNGNGRHLHLDILDNAPQLKGSPLNYPRCVTPGHYGLRVVNDIVEQLGEPATFDIPHPLTPDAIQRYLHYDELKEYNWEPSLWTRTSIRLKAEWD